MPDFQFVQSPIFTPTACATCSAHLDRKGFVDLLVDNPLSGRLYMCATCVERAGKELKMLAAHQARDLTDRLARANNKITDLEAKLEAEKQEKFVSLKDVRDLLRQPSEPVAAA